MSGTLEEALERAHRSRHQAEAELFEELRIPSVSTLPRHRADVRRNAEWLRDRLIRLGFKTNTHDVEDNGHPVLQADWDAGPGAPHLTIYGHYDVQPPDPLAEWLSPPFEPTVRDGRVFARGAADNKGNHMAAIQAAGHYLSTQSPPLSMRFLIEGEEEISGQSLPRYVRQNAERLKTDCIFLFDGGFTPDGKPAILVGMRGLLYVELEATGPAHDLHSGAFGGVAPNPLNSLSRILGDLKSRDGRVTIPGFYDRVKTIGEDEVKSWARPADYDETLKREMGSTTLEGELEFTAAERQFTRPTLDVNGFMGGFTDEGKKTVIPARAKAKVSMRLVPDQDPAEILASLSKYISELTTPGVNVRVQALQAASPLVIESKHRAATLARNAWEAAFGVRPVFVRSGGTIPVAAHFHEALGAPMVVGGLGQPGYAPHAPNENLSLDLYHRGIEMMLRFMYGIATDSR